MTATARQHSTSSASAEEATAAFWTATWIDVAPQVPFTLADLHDALDPVCGQTEVLRIVDALIRYGLIHQTTRHGREWVADRPLLTRVGSSQGHE